MAYREFKIRGLDCAEEVAVLKKAVSPLVGGEENLRFDILRGKMIVTADADSVSTEAILNAVRSAGMKAEVWKEDAGEERSEGRERIWRVIFTGVGGLFLIAALTVHFLGKSSSGSQSAVPAAARWLYLVSLLASIRYVIEKVWFSIRSMRPDMHFLMTLAVIGAVAIGEWFEAATVAFLFSLSLLLEAWSVGKARRAVESLLSKAPATARIRGEDGGEEEIPAETVPVGSVFIVRPGEKIPLDGKVLRGTSDVDQSPITGESTPAAKEPGDEVFAGTINGNGTLEVESTKTADHTTLANIIRMVSEAQSRRAPSERWVERFARYYTPAVISLAVTVAVVPPLFLSGAWSDWFYRALVLLVISCPCALVISTPVAIVAGLAAAAHRGVLVKGGAYLEGAAHLKAIAFDKTGTLTEGRPRVVDLVSLNGHTDEDVLERAAAIERGVNHPLGAAIVEEAARRGVSLPEVQDFKIIPGKGASARIREKLYWLGSHRYLEERGQETKAIHERLNDMAAAGNTVTVVGTADHVCGLIALADSPRRGVKEAIEALRALGIEKIVMLTGDNEGTARAIGRALGVDEVLSELLPEDKVREVERLVERYGQVAMVGDGVNDAPAMGRASLGVAMGAAGSDTAIETADIALMSDDVGKVPWLVGHARRALRIIRENTVLSLAVKALFFFLVLVGSASLWGAIAADTGASLVVIFNSLRLLR